MVVDPSKLHDFDDAMITNLKIIIKTGLTDINEKNIWTARKFSLNKKYRIIAKKIDDNTKNALDKAISEYYKKQVKLKNDFLWKEHRKIYYKKEQYGKELWVW